MSALSTKLRSVRGTRIAYFCPGCKRAHVLPVEGGGSPRWQWDGNVEAPTLSPSILATSGPRVCHHFLRSGRLEFLGDCTHELKGQTVPLPDWPASYSDGDRE